VRGTASALHLPQTHSICLNIHIRTLQCECISQAGKDLAAGERHCMCTARARDALHVPRVDKTPCAYSMALDVPARHCMCPPCARKALHLPTPWHTMCTPSECLSPSTWRGSHVHAMHCLSPSTYGVHSSDDTRGM